MDPNQKKYDNSGAAFEADIEELYNIPDREEKADEKENEEGPE